jgi:deoxyribodipyrimidine photo-lyase
MQVCPHQMAKKTPILLWLRKDLRLSDHPSLTAAIQTGHPVIPLYIHSPNSQDPKQGAASKWWLHHSLLSLRGDLKRIGGNLIIKTGEPASILATLCKSTSSAAVYVSRGYEPSMDAADQTLAEQMKQVGIQWHSFPGHLLREPDSVRNQSGKPFQVFTPFWKTVSQTLESPTLLPPPTHWPSPRSWPKSDPLEACQLLSKIGWDAGFSKAWNPGESGALDNIRRFCSESFDAYQVDRDFPGTNGTSKLSPHLHLGEITPRQIWHQCLRGAVRSGKPESSIIQSTFMREIGWREFAHHLLIHFPSTIHHPLRPEFASFPWQTDSAMLEAWQKGQTGYPIVDAGMRELWATGWMHNRVRMIVGSFLVKHLLMDWKEGTEWFWDTLVDADLANNTLGWQWIAGCGADAAPYFRIFNPITQSEKFAGDGNYIRKWVPELKWLPTVYLHAPWKATESILKDANLRLGKTYPKPMVNHMIARETALEAYQRMKSTRSA